MELSDKTNSLHVNGRIRSYWIKFCDYIRSGFYNLKYFHSVKNRVYFGRFVKLRGNVFFSQRIFIDDNVEITGIQDKASSIGCNVSINRNTVVRGYFLINANVAIGPNCMIVGINHNFNNMNVPIKEQGFSVKGIIIENDVWIGANCVILDGVTIGKGSVIGAGSVVTKSIPSNSVAVGNPCRVIKSRQ